MTLALYSQHQALVHRLSPVFILVQGNDDYDPEASTYFLKSFVDLNSEMLAANARIDTPHHWQSSVAQWVVNGRGLLYWTHGSNININLHSALACDIPCTCT